MEKPKLREVNSCIEQYGIHEGQLKPPCKEVYGLYNIQLDIKNISFTELSVFRKIISDELIKFNEIAKDPCCHPSVYGVAVFLENLFGELKTIQ